LQKYAILVNRKATWDVTEDRETIMAYTTSPLVIVSMSSPDIQIHLLPHLIFAGCSGGVGTRPFFPQVLKLMRQPVVVEDSLGFARQSLPQPELGLFDAFERCVAVRRSRVLHRQTNQSISDHEGVVDSLWCSGAT
jgi:hypothetical protein